MNTEEKYREESSKSFLLFISIEAIISCSAQHGQMCLVTVQLLLWIIYQSQCSLPTLLALIQGQLQFD